MEYSTRNPKYKDPTPIARNPKYKDPTPIAIVLHLIGDKHPSAHLGFDGDKQREDS